jgi:uncharacterized protein (DUF433 family)
LSTAWRRLYIRLIFAADDGVVTTPDHGGNTMKRFLATAVTTALLATGGVAVAGAATDSSSTPKPAAQTTAQGHPRARLGRLAFTTAAKTIGIKPKDLIAAIRKGQTVADVAKAHNVDAKTVEDAITAAINRRIDAAVAAGRLDATRAATLKDRAAKRVKTFVEATPKRLGHGLQQARRGLVATAAKTIGIQPKDLVAQLRAGKTVAQVAQAHGVDPQTVIDAIVKAGTRRLTAAAEHFVNQTGQHAASTQ